MRKITAILFGAGLVMLSTTVFAQDFSAVQNVFGLGEVKNGVLVLEFPRSDLNVQVDGTTLRPEMGVESIISFQPVGDGMVATGDIVVAMDELKGVIQAALRQGIAVTAIHDHLVNETPAIRFVHIEAAGDAAEVARTIRNVLEVTGNTTASTETPGTGEGYEAVQAILGECGSKEVNGVLKYSLPLLDSFLVGGVRLRPEMGAQSMIHFQGSRSSSIMNVEIVTEGRAVDMILDSMENNGLVVAAVHNHFIDDNPRLFYIHALGRGSQAELATAAREAVVLARGNRGPVLSNISGTRPVMGNISGFGNVSGFNNFTGAAGRGFVNATSICTPIRNTTTFAPGFGNNTGGTVRPGPGSGDDNGGTDGPGPGSGDDNGGTDGPGPGFGNVTGAGLTGNENVNGTPGGVVFDNATGAGLTGNENVNGTGSGGGSVSGGGDD